LALARIKQIVLPTPPMTEQREIVEALAVVDRKLTIEGKRRQTLEVLLKTLLHNLMTGKLRVGDLDLSKAGELV
jgi:type I restriction enzyme, S subunit